MRFSSTLLLACAVLAPLVSSEDAALNRRGLLLPFKFRSKEGLRRRASDPVSATPNIQLTSTTAASGVPAPKYLTAKTKRFVVNGATIPDVNFNVGESYAGNLPLTTDPKETRSLYFWFFPTANTDNPKENIGGDQEILIWLNGGPGCSSLEGIFQENGPFLWQYGTYKPVKNPWSWHKLTNVLWIEQPVGTGFSQGTPTAKSSADAAQLLASWFKIFVDTFDLKGKKIYIAGESYAGTYIPYITDAFFSKNDTQYYNVQGTMLYDPLIGEHHVQDQVPAADYAVKWKDLFALNDTFIADIKSRALKCGYTQHLAKYLTYPPPKGYQPTSPLDPAPGCDIWMDILDAVLLINPCFDIYQIATTCPLLWDNLGFPGSQEYLPPGATIYFDRPEVKKALNAPAIKWTTCSDGNVFVGDANGADLSPPPIYKVLPRVIEKSKRTIIAHGQLDYVLIDAGTLLAIQNMTWGGLTGFQKPPSERFLVPYHADGPLSTIAGAGDFGTAHTERGLTWSSMKLTGHMVPQYAPSAAYRQLQFLLGRIPSLNV